MIDCLSKNTIFPPAPMRKTATTYTIGNRRPKITCVVPNFFFNSKKKDFCRSIIKPYISLLYIKSKTTQFLVVFGQQ
jgi:hypothetical protein